MEAPQIIPPYIFAGKQQFVVLEFKKDLPPSSGIITLTFSSNDVYYDRIPVTQIGPKALKAFLPAFKVCGVYSVIPKFDLTEQQTCPPFDIKVLSPLEAMNTCLMSSSSADVNYGGLLAAFVAYLIKMEEKGERVENVDFIDDVFYNTIKKMEIPRSDLATFLAGGYSSGNLLHFSLKQRLHWTSDWLSNRANVPSNDWFSSFNNDGQTPVDLARNIGLLGHAESMQQYMEIGHVEEKNSKVKAAAAVAEDAGTDLTRSDITRRFTKVGSKLKRAWTKKLKKKVQEKPLRPSGSSGIELAESFITQLKQTALYTAEVSEDYNCSDHFSGSLTLKVGDIVHVIREDESGMCMGIVDTLNKYCKLPVNILQAIAEESDDSDSYYSHDDSEASSDYEPVNYNDNSAVQGKSFFLNRKGQLGDLKSQSVESGLNSISKPPYIGIGMDSIDSRPPAALPKTERALPLPPPTTKKSTFAMVGRPHGLSKSHEDLIETIPQAPGPLVSARPLPAVPPKTNQRAEPERPNVANVPNPPQAPGPLVSARPLPAVPPKTNQRAEPEHPNVANVPNPPQSPGFSGRPLPGSSGRPLPAVPPKTPDRTDSKRSPDRPWSPGPSPVRFSTIPNYTHEPNPVQRPLPPQPSTGQGAHPLPALPPKTSNSPSPIRKELESSGRPLPAVPTKKMQPSTFNKEPTTVRPLPSLPPKQGPEGTQITINPAQPPVTNWRQDSSESPHLSRGLPKSPLVKRSDSQAARQASSSPAVPKKPIKPKQSSDAPPQSPATKKKPLPPPRVSSAQQLQNSSDDDDDSYDDTLAFRKELAADQLADVQNQIPSVKQMITKLNKS